MTVFADMGASPLVVFNGLRLMRWNGAARDPAIAAPPMEYTREMQVLR